MGLKSCTACNKFLPRTEEYFHKHPQSADGLKPRCKVCRRVEERTRYQEGDKEKRIALSVAWGQQHPAKRAVYNARYRQNHSAQYAVYWRVRRQRKAQQFVEKVYFDVVFNRDYGLCQLCGQPVAKGEATLDHIIPISKGGVDAYSNVQLAHSRCNSVKGNRG